MCLCGSEGEGWLRFKIQFDFVIHSLCWSLKPEGRMSYSVVSHKCILLFCTETSQSVEQKLPNTACRSEKSSDSLQRLDAPLSERILIARESTICWSFVKSESVSPQYLCSVWSTQGFILHVYTHTGTLCFVCTCS